MGGDGRETSQWVVPFIFILIFQCIIYPKVVCVFFFFGFNAQVLFIYLFVFKFLAALGLRCCARAFSSCGEWGLLFIAVNRLLIAVASPVAEHGL